MPNFMVRIELHDENPDYRKLYELMIKLQYSDEYLQYPSKYKLPEAQYVKPSRSPMLSPGKFAEECEIHKEVNRISEALKVKFKKFNILVTTFDNLNTNYLTRISDSPFS